MAEKKIPMRTCIACRSEKPKRELIRIVKSKDGAFSLDRTGKASGRGAYLCDNKACAQKIVSKKLLNRAFSMEVDANVYKQIEEDFLGTK